MLVSIFGGICIGLAAFASVGIAKPLNGIIFAIGLFMILNCGYSLFTGKVLELRKPSWQVIRNLILVFLGNAIGCLAVAIATKYSGYDLTGIISLAETKANLTHLEAFLRAIPCNFLVCMAVLSYQRIKGGEVWKTLAVILPVTLFVVAGFEHCVADMFYYYFSDYSNLLYTTLGNIVGGYLIIWSIK